MQLQNHTTVLFFNPSSGLKKQNHKHVALGVRKMMSLFTSHVINNMPYPPFPVASDGKRMLDKRGWIGSWSDPAGQLYHSYSTFPIKMVFQNAPLKTF